jgi:hypothetical protein
MFDIMKEKKSHNLLKAGSLVLVIVIGFIAAMMYLPSLNNAIYPQPMVTTTWHLIKSYGALGTEGNPGAGVSGFLEIFFINHTATPTTAYDTNVSSQLETWCNATMAGLHPYANADNFITEVDYGVTFDIVVRVRFNKTNAWDGAKFIGANTRVNITLTGFGTAGMTNITGTNVITYNNTGAWAIWENWFWQDVDGGTGTGYSILKGSPYTSNKIIMINIWAKY